MPIPHGYTETLHAAQDRLAVEAGWTSFSEHAHQHRVLPDGRCDIILHFKWDDAKSLGPISVRITGSATRFHIVSVTANTGFVAVRLRPGTAKRILGIHLKEIANGGFGGNDALTRIPSLARLCDPAQNVDELRNRLDTFVADRSRDMKIDPLTADLIDTLHTTGGRLAISDIATVCGINVRSAHRRIVDATGLTPKQMAMVIQFHRALHMLIDQKLDIASVAFEAGYADQPHMTRAFRQMGGFSPAQIPSLVLAGLPG
jgi:AraC-like DNA-binding protein